MHNENLEKAILGYILLNESEELKMVEKIQEKYFYFPDNQKFVKFLKNRKQQGYTIDGKVLMDNGIFATEQDGKNFITDLLNTAYGIVFIGDYYKELKALYIRREIDKKLKDNQIKIEEIALITEKLKEEIEDNEKDTIQEINHSLAERILSIKTDTQEDFVKTDLMDFDRTFGGLNKKQVILLAGSPSMGKSTLALQIALNVARQGKVVLFFSQEMSDIEIGNKIISNLYNINSYRIFKKNIFPDEMEKIETGKEFDKINNKLFLDYTSNINPDYVDKKILEMEKVKKIKVDLVIVDHLHIMKSNIKTNTRNEELGLITSDLKAIAKKRELPILLLAQLSRKDKTLVSKDLNNYRPDLIDIRESGNIEANCDLISFIYRPEYYLERYKQGLNEGTEKNELETRLNILKGLTFLLVKKNRNGVCGEVKINFQPEFSKFEDIKGGKNEAY